MAPFSPNVAYGSLAWANHLGCPWFEDLALMMSPRFVHQESELLITVLIKYCAREEKRENLLWVNYYNILMQLHYLS